MQLISKYVGCFFIMVVCSVNAVEPPYILVEQPLSFGKIAVVSHATAYSVSIDEDGKMTADNGIYIIEVGSPAELLMVNYTPYTQYNLSVVILDSETTTGVINSNQFTLKNVTVPATITTDSKGEASFFVGGTLETSGDTSKPYYDANYQAKYIVSITF